MGIRQAAFGASMFLILNGFPATGIGQPANPRDSNARSSAGLRTDRLSGKDLKKWKRLVEIVMAEDLEGRPSHPTLRRLWDTVDASGHTIFIEMPDTKSYFAGRFEVTTADPEGRAHVGVILLNLRAIDRASTGPAAVRADGFTPFKGLDKIERYAEVLGHELAHAVWHLSSPDQARLAQQLQGRMEEQVRTLQTAWSGENRGADPARPSSLDRLAAELEVPAEAAERTIWEELRASRRSR
jgi:hypothetical protein